MDVCFIVTLRQRFLHEQFVNNVRKIRCVDDAKDAEYKASSKSHIIAVTLQSVVTVSYTFIRGYIIRKFLLAAKWLKFVKIFRYYLH